MLFRRSISRRIYMKIFKSSFIRLEDVKIIEILYVNLLKIKINKNTWKKVECIASECIDLHMLLRATRMLHSYVDDAKKGSTLHAHVECVRRVRGVVGAAWHYRLYVQYIQGVPCRITLTNFRWL